MQDPIEIQRRTDDVRRQDHEQLAPLLGLRAVTECRSDIRQVAEPRELVLMLRVILGDQPAEGDGFAVLDGYGRLEVLHVKDRRVVAVTEADRTLGQG